MSLEVFPEIFDRALERLDGAGGQGAKGIARAEQFTLLFQYSDIIRFAPTVLDGMQYLFDPG